MLSCPPTEVSGWLNGCRSRVAKATVERLPIAACRSRLTFGGVESSRVSEETVVSSTVGGSGFHEGSGPFDTVTEEPASR